MLNELVDPRQSDEGSAFGCDGRFSSRPSAGLAAVLSLRPRPSFLLPLSASDAASPCCDTSRGDAGEGEEERKRERRGERARGQAEGRTKGGGERGRALTGDLVGLGLDPGGLDGRADELGSSNEGGDSSLVGGLGLESLAGDADRSSGGVHGGQEWEVGERGRVSAKDERGSSRPLEAAAHFALAVSPQAPLAEPAAVCSSTFRRPPAGQSRRPPSALSCRPEALRLAPRGPARRQPRPRVGGVSVFASGDKSLTLNALSRLAAARAGFLG